MAESIEVGGAGKMTKVNPQQTKLRAAFKEQFPDDILKSLFLGKEQSRLLAEMKSFKETEGIQDLKMSLDLRQKQKGRKDIVEVFDGYLTQGLPTKEQYLKDMSRIKKNYKDIPQRPDDFINIEKFFAEPEATAPVSPPSLNPEEEEKEKMGKEDVKEKFKKLKKDVEEKQKEEELQKFMEKELEKFMEESKEEQEEQEETKEEEKEETKQEEQEEEETKQEEQEKPKKEKMRTRRTVRIEPEILPTKMDSIPPSRLSSSFKDVDDLNDDIKYFLKNFKSILKTEAGFYKKVDKKNKNQLIKLHSRIVGKLSPKIKTEGFQGKKVGVVIDAQEYIKNEMKRLLENNSFSRMRPQDVVIDVGDNTDKDDPDAQDIGDFEIKKGPDGLAARREAIYRYLPTEADEEVGMKGRKRASRKPKRLANIPLKPINERYTAERMVARNPFARNVRTIKLKYLY